MAGLAGIIAARNSGNRPGSAENVGRDAIFQSKLLQQEAAEAAKSAALNATRELREAVEAEEEAKQAMKQAEMALGAAAREELEALDATRKAEEEEEVAKRAQEKALLEHKEAEEAKLAAEEAERKAAQACADAEKEMKDVETQALEVTALEAKLVTAQEAGEAEGVTAAEAALEAARETLKTEEDEAREAIQNADSNRAMAMEAQKIAEKELAEASDAAEKADSQREAAAEKRAVAERENEEARKAKEVAQLRQSEAVSFQKKAQKERAEAMLSEKKRVETEKAEKLQHEKTYREEWVKGPQDLKPVDVISFEILVPLCSKLDPSKGESSSRSELRKIEFMKSHLKRRAQDMHDDLHFLSECYRMLDCGSTAVLPAHERESNSDERTWKRLGAKELQLWLCVLSHGDNPSQEELRDATNAIMEHRTIERPTPKKGEQRGGTDASTPRAYAPPPHTDHWESGSAGGSSADIATKAGSSEPYGFGFIDFLLITFDFYVALGPEPLRATFIDLILT